MHKFSAVALAAVAFAAVCADAASTSIPSKRVFSRQDDFVYRQVARDSLNDAYERDSMVSKRLLGAHDSNLERRVTVGEVVGAGAVAWGAHEVVKSHEKEEKKEASSSSLAEATPTPPPARRAVRLESRVTVGEVVGAGAVAWGAHEIVKSHEKEEKKKEQASSTSSLAEATPTPAPARRAATLQSRVTVGEVVGAGAVAWGAHEIVKSHEKEEKKKEQASSTSSLAEATPTPARRAATLQSRVTVGEVVGAGAVAWGAHEIVKSHEKEEKKKEQASSTSSLAEATPTPTPARRAISLNAD